MRDYSKFKDNVFSQFGEDGIVREILRSLEVAPTPIELDKWCVEFGAWDGIHGSNTYNLIRNHEYRSVLIEPDKAKYQNLVANIPDPRHTKMNLYVGLDPNNKLEALLKGTGIPQYFDFLSIDIDGMDYFIWQSLLEYRPKLVCIEFNPTVPSHVSFIQPRDFGINQGSSARAIKQLAEEKDYTLVAATHTNLFFVDSKYRNEVLGAGEQPKLEDVIERSYPDIYVFSGYDGSIHLTGKLTLPWHGIELDETSLQYFPEQIRTFPPNYTKIQRFGFLLFRIRRNGFRWGAKLVARTAKKRLSANAIRKHKD